MQAWAKCLPPRSNHRMCCLKYIGAFESLKCSALAMSLVVACRARDASNSSRHRLRRRSRGCSRRRSRRLPRVDVVLVLDADIVVVLAAFLAFSRASHFAVVIVIMRVFVVVVIAVFAVIVVFTVFPANVCATTCACSAVAVHPCSVSIRLLLLRSYEHSGSANQHVCWALECPLALCRQSAGDGSAVTCLCIWSCQVVCFCSRD